MSNDQVAADTAALQNYIKQLKGFDESKRASEKQRILNETLKDSSQVAKDVAQNTNNLDDVMKVYTASTRTATSVAKSFGKALLGTITTAVAAAAIGAIVSVVAEKIDNAVHAYENARDKAKQTLSWHSSWQIQLRKIPEMRYMNSRIQKQQIGLVFLLALEI